MTGIIGYCNQIFEQKRIYSFERRGLSNATLNAEYFRLLAVKGRLLVEQKWDTDLTD